jgi:hypothetical protein
MTDAFRRHCNAVLAGFATREPGVSVVGRVVEAMRPGLAKRWIEEVLRELPADMRRDIGSFTYRRDPDSSVLEVTAAVPAPADARDIPARFYTRRTDDHYEACRAAVVARVSARKEYEAALVEAQEGLLRVRFACAFDRLIDDFERRGLFTGDIGVLAPGEITYEEAEEWSAAALATLPAGMRADIAGLRYEQQLGSPALVLTPKAAASTPE